MTFTCVRTERRDKTTLITLDRPDKRNALSLTLREELVEALNLAIADPDCAVIVLTGAGSGFCSGADLSETNGKALPMEARAHRLNALQSITRTIVEAPKVVIAAVHGSAYGAGLSIAAACDHVVAARTAKFCAIFSRIGLLPDAGVLWTLPRRTGYGASRRMLLSGEALDSNEALACGLADRVVDDDDMLTSALAYAEACALAAPLSVIAIKRALATDLPSLDAVFRYESEIQFQLSDSQDSAEAKAAFFARRPPQFRGL